MTDPVKDALAGTRRAQGAIGNTPVFRAPKDPQKPCSRHLFDSWLRRAYEVTELPRERWMMWHSIRRKWATERKGYPVRDVMEAGGWKNEETLLRSYQQPDAETRGNSERDALGAIHGNGGDHAGARHNRADRQVKVSRS